MKSIILSISLLSLWFMRLYNYIQLCLQQEKKKSLKFNIDKRQNIEVDWCNWDGEITSKY